MRRQSSGCFLYVALRTVLSAAEGHFESAIDGQNPSAQAPRSQMAITRDTIGETVWRERYETR